MNSNQSSTVRHCDFKFTLNKKLEFNSVHDNDPMFVRESSFNGIENSSIFGNQVNSTTSFTPQKQCMMAQSKLSSMNTHDDYELCKQMSSQFIEPKQMKHLSGNGKYSSQESTQNSQFDDDDNLKVQSYNSQSTNLDDSLMSSQSSKGSSPQYSHEETRKRDSNAIFEIEPKQTIKSTKEFFISSVNSELLQQNPSSTSEMDVDDLIYQTQSVEDFVKMQEQPKFKFDPENGGGRRRRLKKVSRIDMLFSSTQNKSEQDSFEIEQTQSNSDTTTSSSMRPLGVSEDLYQMDSDSRLLQKMADCRHPELNTIDTDTLASLIISKTQKFKIIDCRFDYEYNGGHIEGAMNMNHPDNIEQSFFTQKDIIEEMMKDDCIIIFHCEFSQQRGPKMYRTMRELDRQLNLEYYPQLFYPEIYLLEGGYKEFYSKFPQLCQGDYVQMENKEFKEDCRIKYNKSKTVFKKYSSKEARSRLLSEGQ